MPGFYQKTWIVFLFATFFLSSYSSISQNLNSYFDSIKNSDTQLQKEYYARKALKKSRNKNNKEGIAKSFYQLGKISQSEGNTADASGYYAKAVKLLEEDPELLPPRVRATLYKDYADNFLSMSSYRKALKYYIKTNQIATENDFREIEMNTTRKMGNVYFYLDDYERSSEYYYHSLSVAREIDHQKGIAFALNNIASNLNSAGNIDEALKIYKKGLEIAQKNNIAEAIGIFSNNMGDIYMKKGDRDSALDYFGMGLSWANKNNDYQALATYYNNIASVYLDKQNYAKAREFFRKSYKNYNKIGNKNGLANFYLNYSDLHLKAGNLDSAKRYLEKADEIKNQLSSLSLKSNYYKILHRYYTKQDSFAQALDFYKKHKHLEDSIMNMRTQEKISSLNAVYTEQEHQKQLTELKDKKEELQMYLTLVGVLSFVVISSIIYAFVVQRKWNKRLKDQNIRFKSQQRELAQKNKELNESQKKLEELNKDRNQLFSIISHDLRSPFNSLLGFSEMLIEEVKEGKDYDSIEMMTENIYKSSMQLFELIQNLLEWANSERGKIQFKPEKIILRKVADENINLAKHTAQQKGVEIINDINRGITVVADMNMLNTILRNLIFNSVKFTSRNGYVKLYAEDRKDDVKVYIIDNGMGMTKEEKERILYSEDTFSKEGTNKEKGAGLGLILVKNFLKKHQGELDIDTTINKGTTFSFTIPKNSS